MDEMRDGALCERCGTRSMRHLRDDPPGFALHRCVECGEILRACPWCGGQGWLRHYVVDDDPRSRYQCDECRCVWDSTFRMLTPIGRPHNAASTLGTNPVLVRDYEHPDDDHRP